MSNTTTEPTTAREPGVRTVTFFVEKETPNTVKFEEVPARAQAPLSGSLYLKKYAEQAMASEMGVESLYGLEVTIRGIAAPPSPATA